MSDVPPAPEKVRRRSSVNRDELASRLAYWPLLRLLLLDWRFRVALALMVVVFLAAAVGLPRIWKVTPEGFNPEIYISALDYWQAGHYGREARRLDQAQSYDQAARVWKQAVANNPGDPSWIRGSLENLMDQPPRNLSRFHQALQQTFWLLQITGTNRQDRVLAVQVLEHFGVDDLLVTLVRQAAPPVTPEEKAAQLKALIRLGQSDEYQRERRAWTGTFPPDSDLLLYQAAWQAAWGTTDERAAGWASLEASAVIPATRLSALRLMLLAASVRGDLTRYESTIHQLRDEHADEPLHHVRLWSLLRAAGRTQDAIAAAQAYNDPPLTAHEVTAQAQGLLALGLREDATQFLERYAAQLGSSGNIWASYAQLLIEEARWPELRALAGQIRQSEAARLSLGGYSWFLEGLALHHLGNEVESAAALASVPQYPLRDAGLAFDTARRLMTLNAWAPARDLLLTQEATLGQFPDFWRQLVRAGWEMRDLDLIRRAAEKQYALAPTLPAAQNDLAAVLLIQSVENERALELTSRLVRSNPTSLPARVNHACALIRNGQPTAAKPLILSVDEAQLDPVSLTALNCVRAELAATLGQAPETLRALGQINTNLLLEPQRLRYQKLRQRAEAGFPTETAEVSNPR